MDGPQQFDSDSYHPPPISWAHALAGLATGVMLLALATWVGMLNHSADPDATPTLRIEDANRGVIYVLDEESSDIRVLNVRGGISELARLRHAERGAVHRLSLDDSRRWLRVDAEDATYVYDTQTFTLSERQILLASERTHRAPLRN